jgi:ABC-type nitrate/sulfonate/bicarbonate transport system ATPase subunit
MHKNPAELSQGMRQRVGIARAFALKPKMLLLDEPFGMLDSLTRYELQQVLIELWRKNKITALMVTHDVDEALFLSDRVVCMTDGPEAEVGEILDVRFPRPRERKAVMEHPDYYVLREQLIEFLEVRAHRHKKPAAIPPASPPPANTLHSDSEIRTEPETETVNA